MMFGEPIDVEDEFGESLEGSLDSTVDSNGADDEVEFSSAVDPDE